MNKFIKVQLYRFSLIAFVVVFGNACKTHEKLVYFQSGELSTVDSLSNYTPTIKTGDLLSILVIAENPESVEPFNLPVSVPTQSSNDGYTNGIAAKAGYTVNADSCIIFPIIGKIKLVGLSMDEATHLISEKLKTYVTDPSIQIRILNFKITVLGDVQKPGTYKIPNERITILEAFGLAGDLNITGNRSNICVLRDINGEKQEFRIDLTQKDILSSPAYYLTQNDVVYVEPNRAARNNSTIWKTSGSIFISTAALIITTVGVILK